MIPSPFPAAGPPLPYSAKLQSIKPAAPRPQVPSVPRYVNYAADYGGCGAWRVLWPEYVLNFTGAAISSTLTCMVQSPEWYTGIKAIKIQRQVDTHQLEFIKFLKSIQPHHKFKLIYEIDDVIFKEDIPDYNPFKFAFDNDTIRQNSIDIINLCDEVVVTCEYMKQLYMEKTGKQEITVIPNFPPHFWIGQHYNKVNVRTEFTKNIKRPRILYSGSGAHYDIKNKVDGKDDFAEVIEFVRSTVDKYQWVFLGAFPPPLLPLVKSGKIEFHPWVNLLEYPNKLVDLKVQLTIAPLQDNKFNKSKSDIKFIESAILGIPCLCQNICTYDSAPDRYKFSNITEFKTKLESILSYKNQKNYNREISKLHAIGASRYLELEENIGCHSEVMNTPYGSADRKFLAKWNS